VIKFWKVKAGEGGIHSTERPSIYCLSLLVLLVDTEEWVELWTSFERRTVQTVHGLRSGRRGRPMDICGQRLWKDCLTDCQLD